MKTNKILLLASLAVFATQAHAAASKPDNDTIVLPTYHVTAPRYQPAEKKVNASLDELRRQAQAPAIWAAEMPAFKRLVVRSDLLKRAAQDVTALHVARL